MIITLIQLTILTIQIASASALPQFLTPSFVPPTNNLVRRQLSFIDNNNSKVSSTNKKSTSSMKSKNADELSDADAYHEMVSAAVDLTSVYVRNGILSGVCKWSNVLGFI